MNEEAVAQAAKPDILTLSFSYRNMCVVTLVKALVELQERYIISTATDICYVLPSDPTVRETITKMADSIREDLRCNYIQSNCGGITCERLKVNETCDEY